MFARRPGGGRMNRRGVGSASAASASVVTPADFGTLVAWIDPRYEITHTGDSTPVTAWNDHGPNGYTGTIVNAPTYEATGWGGTMPSVLFDGIADALAMDSVAAFASGDDKPLYVVMAVQVLASTGAKCILSFGNSASSIKFTKLETLSSDRYYAQRRDDAAALVAAPSTVSDLVLTTTILTWEFSGTTTTLYKNGTVTGINASALNNGTVTLDRFALAAHRYSIQIGFINARFGPVLAYSSLTDRAGAEAWFASEGYTHA